jgi:DNA repair protein RecN (Recombination protein N)
MLSKIYVSNYLLIQQLEVDFNSGFTVITGETGAGKSIILGALALILGERAQITGKRIADKKIVAEGEFNIDAYNIKTFFDQQNLDFEPQQTCLRREILPSGKSRAFINDTPVNISVLKALGQKLVDIHSQHENQLLLKPVYQLQFLDAFAGIEGKVDKFEVIYKKWKQIQKEYEDLQEKEQKARKEEDYIRFQLAEINEVDSSNIQFETLQEELNVLEHADTIKSGLSGAVNSLTSGDSNAVQSIKEAIQSIEDISKLSPDFKEYEERLNSVIIELDDINSSMEYSDSTVESNPEKALYIREVIDKVNHLMFKNNLNEFDELVQFGNDLQNSLNQIDGFTEEIELKTKELKAQENKMNQMAGEITKNRKKSAPKLEKLISKDLSELGMPNTTIQIVLEEKEECTLTGKDDIEILFSANKGFEPQSLEKVASGGERSRLMLVLKKIHASVAATPTLILDEIDTGISGEVAAKTAQMLSEMAVHSQIISISHLPQVAGKASHHLEVSKKSDNDVTETTLRVLTSEERRIEIARMLSGENITEAALENADQLMQS